jgi:hypothetical protein
MIRLGAGNVDVVVELVKAIGWITLGAFLQRAKVWVDGRR